MRRLPLIVLAAAALLAVVVIAIRLLPDSAPDADLALIDASVLHVLRGWQPLGAYSRFGGNHPGPLYFQVLAPLYGLSGYRHLAVLVTVAAINAGSLIGALVVVRRYARSSALPMAGVALFAWYLIQTAPVLSSPWNPHVLLLPLVLLFVAAAAASSGAYALLPLVVGVASFAVQSHLGAAPVVTAILGTTAGLIGVDVIGRRRRGEPSPPRLLRALRTSLIVGSLLWAMPLIDELRPNGPHNLRQLVSYFANRPAYDPRAASRAFEHLFVAPFTPNLALEWGATPLPRHEPVVRLAVAAEAVLLIAAAVIFWRRRQAFEARWAVLAIVSGLAGLAAVRGVPEPLNDYTVLWVTVLGVLSWTVVAALPLGWLQAKAVGRVVGLTAATALIGTCVWQVTERHSNDLRRSPVIVGLADVVRGRSARAGTTAPLIHIPRSWGLATGVVLQLYRDGWQPAVDEPWAPMFGLQFRPTGREPVAFTFAEGPEHYDDLTFRSNYDLVGRSDGVFVYCPLPPPAVVARRADLAEWEGTISRPGRLSDGLWSPADADLDSPGAVPFYGPQAYVTVNVSGAVGVRLWGQEKQEWQLRCVDGDQSRRIGRVRIAEGPGVQSGEALLRDLPGCRRVKIAPVDSAVTWLSEIELLLAHAGAAQVPGADVLAAGAGLLLDHDQ